MRQGPGRQNRNRNPRARLRLSRGPPPSPPPPAASSARRARSRESPRTRRAGRALRVAAVAAGLPGQCFQAGSDGNLPPLAGTAAYRRVGEEPPPPPSPTAEEPGPLRDGEQPAGLRDQVPVTSGCGTFSPRRSCSSRRPEPGRGRLGRQEGSPGPGPWNRARLTRGGPRRGRDRGHERPAAPDRKQKPAGPGSAAGICRPPRPRGAHTAPDGLLGSLPRVARRLSSVTKFSPALSQGSLPSSRTRLLADLLGLFWEITCFAPTYIPFP